MIINTPAPAIDPNMCIEPTADGFPNGCGFVFDEAHYIPAVRKLIHGFSTNHEHPPLSKLLIAGSILALGDNPLGWRLIPSILSSAAAAMVPLLAWRLTGRKDVTAFSAILLSGDAMLFNIGTIAILDGPALFFLLLGTYFFISSQHIRAALILGLGLLSKTAVLFNVVALLLYALTHAHGRRGVVMESLREWLPVFEKTVLVVAAVFIAGIAIYDYGFGAYSNPFQHIDYMLAYHSQLRYNCREFELPFRCYDGGVAVDLPLSWISPISPFTAAPYHLVSVSAGDGIWHPIAYLGIYSPLWWTTAIVLAFSAYHTISSRGGDRVNAFITAWITAGYGAYFIIAYLLNRWVYTFYFIPTLPALAIGLPTMLSEGRTGRIVLYTLTIIQAGWLFTYFPVKSDTHIQILELLNLPH
jgi:4-amino-4-deoxy-L-arabinose transferase-like glycosyltransferase